MGSATSSSRSKHSIAAKVSLSCCLFCFLFASAYRLRMRKRHLIRATFLISRSHKHTAPRDTWCPCRHLLCTSPSMLVLARAFAKESFCVTLHKRRCTQYSGHVLRCRQQTYATGALSTDLRRALGLAPVNLVRYRRLPLCSLCPRSSR